MVEVAPMLRQLLNSLGARPEAATDHVYSPVARMTDKLDRRLRQSKLEYGQPKSVCTSLRDICEM
jgi:hypothetical protein